MSPVVLVIEKDPLTRETIVKMLEAIRYNVAAYAYPHEAISALKAIAYHILIVSLDKEDLDGSAIALEAKAVQRDLKIIVVSGRYPAESLAPYVDAFVQKPFSMHQIDTAINGLLSPIRAS